MADKRSLRSSSPSKRRSLVSPPKASSLQPADIRKSQSVTSRYNNSSQFSDPIPVLEPSAPYKVSPQSDTANSNRFSHSQNNSEDTTANSNNNRSSSPAAEEVESVNVKVVAIGDGNTGKTCLLVTYANGYFPETYVPTVFENYLTKVRGPKGQDIELALWDTAGQEEYDRLRALSYPEVNVLLVCFAIDAPASLDNVYDKWIPEITHYCPDIPFILVGLKTDLRTDEENLERLRNKGQRPITPEEGQKAGQRVGAFRYMECSSKNREGVSSIFNQAISIVLNQKAGSGADVVTKGTRRELPKTPDQTATTTTPRINNHNRTNTSQQGANSNYRGSKKKSRHRCIIL